MSEVKRFGYFWDVSFDVKDDGAFVGYEDYAELKAQRDALAVENAVLRKACGGDGAYLDCPACTHSQYVEAPETPATNAWINSVRSEVIKEFCQLVGQYGKVEPHHFNSDFADLYAKINKEIYESILDNPAVYDMESLVDWLERGVNDSRAYADMSIQHAAQLRAGEPS